FAAVFIDQDRASRLVEYHRKRPDVATHLRLHPVKDSQVHRILPSFRELTDTAVPHGPQDRETRASPFDGHLPGRPHRDGSENGPILNNISSSWSAPPNGCLSKKGCSEICAPSSPARPAKVRREAWLPGPTVVSR